MAVAAPDQAIVDVAGLSPDAVEALLVCLAYLDVALYLPDGLCRRCGGASCGHAASCPLPDEMDARQPLELVLPGTVAVSSALQASIESITGEVLPALSPREARRRLRAWASHS